MTMTTYEYEVCQDCCHFIANGEVGEDAPVTEEEICEAMAYEIGERNGHFAMGVEATEEDPEGDGYNDFSISSCDLCRTHLAGSRYGVTLVIHEDETAVEQSA